MRNFNAVSVFSLLVLGLGYTQANATQNYLPNPPPPSYTWGSFGLAGGQVQEYRKLDGTAGGPVYVTNDHIYDADPDPLETNPEDIGIVTWNFALWRGSSTTGGAINRAGAAFMGGFNKTDNNDIGSNFGFLQIYRDQLTTANGGTNGQWKVDGGGYTGKVNGTLPGWTANPGAGGNNWNFSSSTVNDTVAYDYIDNPYDNFTLGADTVEFETALACNDMGTVHICGVWKWSFQTDGNGGITGMQPTMQASASNNMMSLYGAMLPSGGTIQNVGVGSCHSMVPEPGSIAALSSGVFGLLTIVRRRKSA